jgi:hypothetical protein
VIKLSCKKGGVPMNRRLIDDEYEREIDRMVNEGGYIPVEMDFIKKRAKVKKDKITQEKQEKEADDSKEKA